MTFLARLLSALRPAPKTAEDLAAERDAARLEADLETARMSQRSAAGSLYESQRRSGR
jgi:hypothetical protein